MGASLSGGEHARRVAWPDSQGVGGRARAGWEQPEHGAAEATANEPRAGGPGREHPLARGLHRRGRHLEVVAQAGRGRRPAAPPAGAGRRPRGRPRPRLRGRSRSPRGVGGGGRRARTRRGARCSRTRRAHDARRSRAPPAASLPSSRATGSVGRAGEVDQQRPAGRRHQNGDLFQQPGAGAQVVVLDALAQAGELPPVALATERQRERGAQRGRRGQPGARGQVAVDLDRDRGHPQLGGHRVPERLRLRRAGRAVTVIPCSIANGSASPPL